MTSLSVRWRFIVTAQRPPILADDESNSPQKTFSFYVIPELYSRGCIYVQLQPQLGLWVKAKCPRVDLTIIPPLITNSHTVQRGQEANFFSHSRTRAHVCVALLGSTLPNMLFLLWRCSNSFFFSFFFLTTSWVYGVSSGLSYRWWLSCSKMVWNGANKTFSGSHISFCLLREVEKDSE